MDKKEKQEKKRFINESIDLSNHRFKDQEVDDLHALVSNKEHYIGMSHSVTGNKLGWDHDGKYTYEYEDRFTVKNDEGRMYIENVYTRKFDDGQVQIYRDDIDNPREILSTINKYFKKKKE